MSIDKDPSTYSMLAGLWAALSEPTRAAFLSTVIALCRVMYDGREPRMIRRLLEAALCGSIALGIASGAEAMGMPAGMGTFIGAAVGLFGADQVRSWGRRIAERKVSDSAKGGR